jgi:TolB-like protein/class 3 adenylate cyclase/Flp pilus assembly protein TadD
MGEIRKLAAILVADVVGYSRLAGADEERTLARLRALRSDLFDPSIALHHGRVVKRTGDGIIIEFRSVVDAVRCAIAVQSAMVERNAGVSPDMRIEFRVGIHLGDVVEEADGDLMGDGVNVAARLEGVCEPGGVCLSSAAYEQVRDKVKQPFVDLGGKALKNIARPVRVFALGAAAVSASRESASPSSRGMPDEATIAAPERGRAARHAWTLMTLAGLALFLLAAGVVGLWMWREDKLVASGVGSPSSLRIAASHPSIVVMPLANLSGDPAQDYFADGLTEDIISALGRFPDMTVISRSAAFAYKGKSAPPDEIGRELSVAYLVDGSLRKTGDRARISVELLETARATLLWTEQYDRDIKNLFTIQDEIGRQIAGALSIRLTALQLARSASKPPSNLEVYDLVLRGRDLSRRDSRAALSQARQLFEHAIELDPGYAPAHAGLGGVEILTAESGYTSDPDGALTRAEANGRRALSNDENVGAHILLGRIYIFRGEYDRALDELRRAVEINPSDPEAQSGLADALLWSGDSKAAIEAMRKVARVQPILTDDEHVDLGIAYLIADRPEDAIAALTRATQRYDDAFLHALLAGAYATAGRKADAAGEAEIVKRMLPAFQAKDFATRLRDQGQRSKVIAALQLAGL